MARPDSCPHAATIRAAQSHNGRRRWPWVVAAWMSVALPACAPAANSDASTDAAAQCPSGPAMQGTACEPAQAGLRCASGFAPNCAGMFDRLYCVCTAGVWACEYAQCDGGADAAGDAAVDAADGSGG